jgi:branched-chain amino acid transport system substrate-binding protein
MRNVRRTILTIIMVAAIAVGGCSFLGLAAEPGVIKVGYSAPFTGTAAEFGTNGWRGVQLALEEINEKGIIINGKTHEIEIIRYDSVCTPTEGVAAIRRLVMEDEVVAVLGDHCSSVCMAIAPVLDELKVPGLTIECAADAVTSPGHEFYFRMRPSMGLMAPLVAPVIMKLNPKTMGFLAINDDYGRSFVTSIRSELEKQGVKMVSEGYFERGTTDFMMYLTKIKRSNPDIVFYIGVTPEGAMILKQARELGLVPDIKFIGAEEMGEMELVKLAGAEVVEGTYAISLWGAVPAEFEKRVWDRFDAPMHYAIIFGYDALQVIAKAIESAQSLDPVKIKDAMKKVEFQGLEGYIKFENFDNYKNQGKYTPRVIQWMKAGQREAL